MKIRLNQRKIIYKRILETQEGEIELAVLNLWKACCFIDKLEHSSKIANAFFALVQEPYA